MATATSEPNLADRSAADLAALVRVRAVSPVEVTRAFLERIERFNPAINAYVTVIAEPALAKAAEAERQVMESGGSALGPLHGVPVSIKDLTETAGVRTTFGSPAFADYVPALDAEVAGRFFRAGAIMLGKTNSPEFGLHGTTEEGLFGLTRNPWDLTRSPGGSSGGAAAALAARLCPLAEGSDGGGSIRGPAAACGIIGLKPARARVPAAPFAGAPWAGLATSGPMARTVADIALGLDVMAGPAVGDPYLTPLPERSFSSAVDETLPPLRIAWTATHPAAAVAPEVAAAIERTAGSLIQRGHELVEGMPDTSGMWRPFLTIIDAHTAAMSIPNPDRLLPHARATYDAGRRLTAVEYLNAERQTYQTARRVLAWFETFDVFVCPTLTRTAPPLGALAGAGMEVWDKLEGFIPFEFWVNMAGLPAVSLPVAWSSDGLPIGVQLVGRQLAERVLIALAAQLEEAFPWRDRRPPLLTA